MYRYKLHAGTCTHAVPPRTSHLTTLYDILRRLRGNDGSAAKRMQNFKVTS